ncbi:Dot/Icm T4SS effector CoxCC5 [Coxiella burnetii]|uniref:Dot/Icm T4SS effector CoxCC5 n=1 Tax=Coxiella burnetii TaxID=777 RepID=UPI0021756FE5|nr:Dot/Icm T4SS effector CoxCC5 [Coxiella burnetii]
MPIMSPTFFSTKEQLQEKLIQKSLNKYKNSFCLLKSKNAPLRTGINLHPNSFISLKELLFDAQSILEAYQELRRDNKIAERFRYLYEQISFPLINTEAIIARSLWELEDFVFAHETNEVSVEIIKRALVALFILTHLETPPYLEQIHLIFQYKNFLPTDVMELIERIGQDKIEYVDLKDQDFRNHENEYNYVFQIKNDGLDYLLDQLIKQAHHADRYKSLR